MHVTPSNFFRRILRSETLVYKSYFFSELWKLFDIRFSYNHCNFSCVCLLVKMASKAVTRSIFGEPSLSFRKRREKSLRLTDSLVCLIQVSLNIDIVDNYFPRL